MLWCRWWILYIVMPLTSIHKRPIQIYITLLLFRFVVINVHPDNFPWIFPLRWQVVKVVRILLDVRRVVSRVLCVRPSWKGIGCPWVSHASRPGPISHAVGLTRSLKGARVSNGPSRRLRGVGFRLSLVILPVSSTAAAATTTVLVPRRTARMASTTVVNCLMGVAGLPHGAASSRMVARMTVAPTIASRRGPTKRSSVAVQSSAVHAVLFSFKVFVCVI